MERQTEQQHLIAQRITDFRKLRKIKQQELSNLQRREYLRVVGRL